MFVPTQRKLYESAVTFVETNGNRGCKDYMKMKMTQTIYITKTLIKTLDRPAQRCDPENKDTNTSACIAGFVARQIGCNPMIYGSQYSGTPPCTTNSELMAMVNSSKLLEHSDGNEIHELTGCLSPCKKYRYSLSSAPLRSHPISWASRVEECQLHLDFVMVDNSYNEEEDYVIYDVNSFIADVGGYMGLLLGSSLLSVYMSIEDVVKRILTNARARKEKY